MSYAIDKYTVAELLKILDLEDPTEGDIIEATENYINRYATDNSQNSMKIVKFFSDAKVRLLSYLGKQDVGEENFDIETDNAERGSNREQYTWETNQYLLQDDKTQSDKYTIRKNKVGVFDNNPMTMKRDKLGVTDTYDVPVAQGTMNPNLKNINTRIVNIDSQFRQDITTSTTNYTLDLSEPLQDVISLKMYSFEIKHTWYTFDPAYGTTTFIIRFLHNGCSDDDESEHVHLKVHDDYCICIPAGNYTQHDPDEEGDLIHAINEQIEEVLNDGDPPVKFSYSDITGKVTVEYDDGDDDCVEIIFFDPKINMCKFCNDNKSEYCEECVCVNDSHISGAKINSNLGWLLGFRPTKHDMQCNRLSIKIPKEESKTGEALLNTYGPRYLLLVVDDFNQNRLNKGLVTMTDTETVLSLPNYYTNNFMNELEHECENVKTPGCFHREENLVMPSAPRKLTQAQLYTINQIKENKERTTKYRYLGPTSADLMAKIPILYDDNNKTHKFPTLIEFTGALNVNKRVYFGPVDITRMRILLLDDKGNVLNLNNMDWSFSLISEHLYQY